MKLINCQRVAAGVLVMTLGYTLTGCASWSDRERSTAVGAGVGAVSGAILSEGKASGTLVGAAVGGLVGNQLGKKK